MLEVDTFYMNIVNQALKKRAKWEVPNQENFVIQREKIKKYIREIIQHWREICPAEGKFVQLFSRPY